MSTDRAHVSRSSRRALSASFLLASLVPMACSEIKLDAVTGGPCEERPEQAACERSSWPNEYSRANSDPWLAIHHDALRELHPRVLVLDFHNEQSLAEVRAAAQRLIEALADGSRYHGYQDDDAPPSLQYELLDVIDLADRPPPSDWAFSSSTRVPVNADGVFDLAALFDPSFDAVYEQHDEDDQPLGLCALFERGVINELWLAVGDTEREPPWMVECKARYGADNRRREGAPMSTTFDVYDDECARLPACGVTVRIAHLSPIRDVGCDLVVRGWAIFGSMRAVPYLARNAQAFFDECGEAERPPNGNMWEYESPNVVEARCAHYGMRDGPDAHDLLEPYSYDTVAGLAAYYPAECGGPWQIYWRQSMPGLDNAAFAEDGSPMKNWWPFLFY